MIVEGGVVPGDTAFMLRCMIEDLLGCGTSAEQVRRMMGNPAYRALYAARKVLGNEAAEALLNDAQRRAGALRVRVWEAPPTVQDVTLTVGGRVVASASREDG